MGSVAHQQGTFTVIKKGDRFVLYDGVAKIDSFATVDGAKEWIKKRLAHVEHLRSAGWFGRDSHHSGESLAKVTKDAQKKRAPPRGGLDLAAMAKAWRAAGKPGDWKSWIKVHPIKHK